VTEAVIVIVEVIVVVILVVIVGLHLYYRAAGWGKKRGLYLLAIFLVGGLE
jgi:hypothetical protein